MRAASADSSDGGGEGASCYLLGIVAGAEVDEPDLTFHECAECARCADLEFRPEQPGERAHLGFHKRGGDSVVKWSGEVAREVVVHLRLQGDVGMNVERDPSADAYKVVVVVAGSEVQVIGVDANFPVVSVVSLRHQPRWHHEEQAEPKSYGNAFHSSTPSRGAIGRAERKRSLKVALISGMLAHLSR